MQGKKSLIEHFPAFLKDAEKRGLSSATLEKKKQNLKAFEGWLCQEKMEKTLPTQLREKHLTKFRKSLLKKGLKEKTADSYLQTIDNLLRYLSKGETESDVQKIVNHYFQTKGYSLEEVKKNARKRKIIYSRYTRPAKDLLHLAGSVEKAKKAIDKVALWANSRNLDYAIETVFKKWPEINKLKPKEKKKKPYYRGDPMVWSKSKQKWFVINSSGDWLEFAGDEKEIIWKEEEN